MQRFEDLFQLLVMLIKPSGHLSLQVIKPLLKRFIGARNTAKLNERPHDRDVDGDRPVTAKNPREHRYSLLGEDIWGVPTPAPAVT